jgi:hypothetical protein
MSDELDWAFSGPDDAKAEIRAAVRYLLKDAAGSDRGDIVRQIIEIVCEVAGGLPPGEHDLCLSQIKIGNIGDAGRLEMDGR